MESEVETVEDRKSEADLTGAIDPPPVEYGEPFKYDPTFKGPIKNRGCTDIICLLLFLVCFLGFLLVGVWSFTQGDPRLLLYPTDSSGNVCGYGDYEDKPYLFFFDLLDCYRVGPAIISQGCPTPQVCVESCPTEYWAWYELYVKEQIPPGQQDAAGRDKMYCKYGISPPNSPKTVKELVENEECAAYYMESSPVAGRCIPAFITKLMDGVTGLITANNTNIVDKYGAAVNGTQLQESTKYLAYLLNAMEYGTKIFQDVRASWWMILVGLGIGMLVSFIWIILMRCIAGPIIWLTLILFVGLFSFSTYFCFTKYVEIRDSGNAQGTLIFTTNLSYYTNLKETWLALGIISASILGIVVLMIICLRERICIAIELIKEASKAVGNMIFTLFWPLIPFVLQLIVLSFWVASALFLASSGTPSFSATQLSNETVNVTVFNQTAGAWQQMEQIQEQVKQVFQSIPCNPDNTTAGQICSFLKYGNDQYTIYLQVFQLFMWLWLMNFVIALGQMTLAGAFASYYWAFTKPQDIPAFPVTASFGRCLRYHLGSLAFGSLIIAIIQLIRIGLEYLDHKLKSADNPVATFIIKCLKCCFWCLEKFMKFLNKNAYIMVAVYGKNFCTSAKNAFFLILRNVVRVLVVDKVADFLMFVGKLMVVGAVGSLAYFFFARQIPWVKDVIKVPELNYYLVPIIIIIIGTYVIASAFFSVYSMGVDTLFLCFLEDLERHDGSPEKPYYMSKGLMEILGKKNRPPGEAEEKSKCCCCC